MSLIEVVKEISIIDVAQQHMHLKKTRDRYKGLCPFHSEKSASFVLYPQSNRYHCFGCGADGSVIDLYAHFNDLKFTEAVGRMKEEWGIEYQEDADYKTHLELHKFLESKKDELRDLLKEWERIIAVTMRDVGSDEELDHFAGLYHEETRIEMWLHNLEHATVPELQELYEEIPSHLTALYKHWGGGKTIEGLHEGRFTKRITMDAE